MPKFTAKERDVDEACFVVEENSKLIIELNKPADLAQAEAVAKYLNRHVRALMVAAKIRLTEEVENLIQRGRSNR